MTTNDSMESSIFDLQRELVETLSERMDELADDWRRLNRTQAQSWDVALAEDLVRQTHNLRGEAALFGLNRLVPIARELEMLFKRSLADGGIDAVAREAIATKLQALRHACRHYGGDNLPELPAGLQDVTDTAPPLAPPLLFVVDDDAKTSSVLEDQLRQHGYEVRCFADLETLEAGLVTEKPAVLVMDIMLREGTLAGVEYVTELRSRESTRLPVVFLSARDDMVARLQACRAGGNAYFTKPVRFHLLCERLDQLTGRTPASPYEILIVDDDPTQAEYYSQALEKAGMTVTVLLDPMEVLAHLQRHRPDLILLDLYMPHCSGPELAAVLQQHEAFLGIPIVFLSSEHDFDQQLEALGLGGEDFLTKPIDPKHLIATIRPRAERGRALGSQIHRDGLTGLTTHSGQKAQLELELARAEREDTVVSFAMLDLDGFKSINDRYGHPAGDRVICALAGVLKKRLRRTDMVARFGGDEFAVVFPNTSPDDARRILAEISEVFSRLVHTAGEHQFSATVSCGIASFPRCADTMQLVATADRALYQAKHQGRNRVVSSG